MQEDLIPICQDTGMSGCVPESRDRMYILKAAVEDAVNEGVRQGYQEGYLRNP